MSSVVVAQLLYLESQSIDKPIFICVRLPPPTRTLARAYAHGPCTTLLPRSLRYITLLPRSLRRYINSPGGVVTSGLAIYDTMQFVKPPVRSAPLAQDTFRSRPTSSTSPPNHPPTHPHRTPPHWLQVATLCVGQACSMGSLLLAGGAPGMRRALPNSRVMIHQPSGGVSGQARRTRSTYYTTTIYSNDI
jgi:hypothetical protein